MKKIISLVSVLALINGSIDATTLEQEEGQRDIDPHELNYIVSQLEDTRPIISKNDLGTQLKNHAEGTELIKGNDPLKSTFVKDKLRKDSFGPRLTWEEVVCFLCFPKQSTSTLLTLETVSDSLPLLERNLFEDTSRVAYSAGPFDYSALDLFALKDLSYEEMAVDREEQAIINENPMKYSLENHAEQKDMAYVPAGTYTLSVKALGSKHYLVPMDNSPLFAVNVKDFYIDKHEVTNREYQSFVTATGHSVPEHWMGGRIPPGIEDQPVVNVTFKDAQAYAKWVGKRLPTEIEWEAAAKHALAGDIAIQNMHAGYSEWTLSPISMTQGVPFKQRYAYAPAQHNMYRIVRQKEVATFEGNDTYISRLTLHQSDSNNQTSFRCVIDVKK